MSLPIDTIALIRGKSVESERLEYKESWNPEDVLHTMCAFANDMHNWGGGYIVIGVAEKDGLPVLPPKGVNPSEINTIRRKLVELDIGLSLIITPFLMCVTMRGSRC